MCGHCTAKPKRTWKPATAASATADMAPTASAGCSAATSRMMPASSVFRPLLTAMVRPAWGSKEISVVPSIQ
jgi:hypothetical protein